jgi:uncharacterized lipoprotein
MRRVLLAVVPVLLICTGCAYLAQQEAAQQAKRAEARAAEYDLPRETVMEAVLSTLLQLDYRIERQHESTGYIETNWASRMMYGARHDVRIVTQVTGERPYRVEVLANVRSQESVTPEPFEDEVYVRIYERLSSR